MTGRYSIITNNPLVLAELGADESVEYYEVTYAELLCLVRDRVHAGARLLSHPLSGSVKPGETPYKSIMLLDRKGVVDEQSLALIENAIETCSKFTQRTWHLRPKIDQDFQLIDLTLVQSALSSVIQ